MRMKNVLLLVFSFILILSLVACGENDMNAVENNEILEQSQTDIEVDVSNNEELKEDVTAELEELENAEELSGLEELLNEQKNVGGDMRMVPILCNRK